MFGKLPCQCHLILALVLVLFMFLSLSFHQNVSMVETDLLMILKVVIVVEKVEVVAKIVAEMN